MTQLATLTNGLTRADLESEEFRATVVFMAEEFQQAAAIIRENILTVWKQTNRINAAFPHEGHRHYSGDFSVGFEAQHSHRYYGGGDQMRDIDKLISHLSRTAWRRLVDRIGIKDLMSVKKRKEFEEQLENGELPEITAETIMAILFSMADQARDFVVDAAKEVFNILLPGQHGHRKKYKVNSAIQIGQRVVLSWFVEEGWGNDKFRVTYGREGEVAAIDNMFHVLDGQAIIRDGRPPLIEAIRASESGVGETNYFKFRCYKNRNLHLEFKRMDLVKKLNALGTGEAVIGNEPTKVKKARRTTQGSL
jgi:hypothetical protein